VHGNGKDWDPMGPMGFPWEWKYDQPWGMGMGIIRMGIRINTWEWGKSRHELGYHWLLVDFKFFLYCQFILLSVRVISLMCLYHAEKFFIINRVSRLIWRMGMGMGWEWGWSHWNGRDLALETKNLFPHISTLDSTSYQQIHLQSVYVMSARVFTDRTLYISFQ